MSEKVGFAPRFKLNCVGEQATIAGDLVVLRTSDRSYECRILTLRNAKKRQEVGVLVKHRLTIVAAVDDV